MLSANTSFSPVPAFPPLQAKKKADNVKSTQNRPPGAWKRSLCGPHCHVVSEEHFAPIGRDNDITMTPPSEVSGKVPTSAPQALPKAPQRRKGGGNETQRRG